MADLARAAQDAPFTAEPSSPESVESIPPRSEGPPRSGAANQTDAWHLRWSDSAMDTLEPFWEIAWL